jgi:benzodiazapine receptor
MRRILLTSRNGSAALLLLLATSFSTLSSGFSVTSHQRTTTASRRTTRPIAPVVPSRSLQVPRAGSVFEWKSHGVTNKAGDSRSSNTALRSTGGTESSTNRRAPFDFAAVGKYALGLAVQMSLIFGVLTGIDKTLAKFAIQIPFSANILFLYAFNLKTPSFSILPQKEETVSKRDDWEFNRPSWTPPGYVFAIMWPLFVFGTRATTAAMMVRATGSYANSAVMALMLHLGIANLWNTINNVEKRLGLSVIALYGMWLSKAYAAWRFFQVDPLAGKALALTLSWLTAAAALETRTWQINPDPTTGQKEPLYPAMADKWQTKFRWE